MEKKIVKELNTKKIGNLVPNIIIEVKLTF